MSKKIEYSKFLLLFELLFLDIESNTEFSVDLSNIKARLQGTAFVSYSAFPPFNLSRDKFELLCKLKHENNLVIQKTDKGNNIIILDKDCHLKQLKHFLKILQNSRTFF